MIAICANIPEGIDSDRSLGLAAMVQLVRMTTDTEKKWRRLV